MSGPRWARWAVLLLVLLGLACVRGRPLGDGPPRIDGRTTVLGTFDPSNSILQTGGGLDLGKVPRAELPEPAIVEWGPIGETSPGMNVQLRFNRPMIPIGERPQIEPGVFTIEPPVAGELEWQDPTRLVFRPHEPLPIATTFTVNFAVRVPNGEPLARTWNFTTTRPQLDMQVFDERLDGTWMTPHPHHRIPVLLSSTQPLRRDALIEHLRAEARDPDTKTAAVMDVEVDELGVHRNGDHRFLIRPRDRWPAARQIVLTVDAKLTGEAGPASIGQPLVYSFENPEGVSVHPPICVEASHHDGCELGPVALDFSEPIDARQARHVRVHPEPPGFGVVAADELEQRGARGQRIYEHLIVWGDFERGVEYTLTIDPALRDVHGQALVGERKLALHFVEPTPSLELDAFDRTLDLAGPATVGVESRHVDELELTLAVLTEAEHERMLRFEYYEQDFPTDLTDLHRQRIKLTHTGSFGWSAHTLDLSSFTQGKPGVLAFELRAGALAQSARGLQPPRRYGLVQLTRLGVTVVGALSGGFVRVARLQDDAPVAGASVELIDKLGAPQSERRLLGHTDARGRLALPSSAELGRDSLLRVREGDDQVLIEIGELSDVTHRERDPELRPHESVRTALMSERPLYLPGETLHVLGWAAIASPYELLGLRPLPEHTKVELSVHDPHGTVVAERTVVAKRHGKFWASLQLPAVGALGRYTVGAKILGEYESHEFQLSEVRPPDFELSAAARNTDIGPGEVPQIELEGTYLFGGSVPIEHAWHSTECSPGWYRPPNVPDGFSIVWDQSAPHDAEELFPSGEITRSSRRVHYELGPAPSVSGPLSCMHWVTAADANARSTNTSTSFLVHPPSYLALSTPEAIELGEQLPVAVRALLPDGSAAKLERVELTLRHTPWGLERPAAPQRCRASVVDDMAKCRLRPRGLGEHELELRVFVDGHERVARERLYVDEPELLEHMDEDQHLDASTLSVAFEDTWLRVGEVAKLDVRTSWPRGHALVLLGKSAVHQLHELEIENGHATLELETDDTWIPGVEVTVLTVQPGVPPRLIRDEARLHVASNSRSLSVILRAPEHASTREQIPIDVEVGDAAGRPVSGHVAVWAIDEAILALEPLNIRSLTSIFAEPHDHDAHVDFGDRYAKLLAPHQPRPDPYSPRTFDPNWMRGVIGLGHTGLIGRGRGGGGTGDGTIGLGSTPMRSNFSSAPFFIADAKLDSQGRARVLGKLPDNLTTFRIVALASAPLPGHKNIEGRSGVAEARVRVTRPLVVRANLPRVLRPGDQAELGVVIDNRSEHDGVLELDVALHGGDAVAALLGATRTRVSMPAGAQISLPFALQAGGVGESMLEIQARLLGEGSFGVHARDGLRTPLQIEPEPAATERVAIYGSMTDDVAMLPLALPADLDPRHGGLRVAIGGSLLAGLSDAAADLFGSRHASAEQIASRLLSLVLFAKRDDFPPLVADPDQHVAVAVDQLVKLQRPDGGFAELAHDRESSPVTSAYVVMVLARAERAGFSVSPYLLMRAPGYLEAELERWLTIPGPTLKQDIEAALLLRARAFLTGAPPDAFSKLFERRARLPLFARVQLLLAILDDDRSKQRGARINTLVTELLANVEETAASARTVSDTGPWVEYWDSSARTNALLLEALLRARPEHPLVFKLVRGLLDARVRGRWASSQENAHALLALLEYAAIHETRTPRFDGRVWLGNSRLAQIEVGGDATGFAQDFTPMTELIAASTDDATALILERAGVGRMHYRVGLDWASTDVDRPAVSAGLELRRELRSADGLLGEQQHVALGSLLALDITVEAEHALDDLAIEVPLPGGLEAMQVANYVTSKLGGERGGWVVHLGLHHDRVVLLADHLEPGAYTTTVFLRAITAGDYRIPAAQAEMIYYPEIHARTTARRVVID